jgi:hypothetical protein
VGAGAGAAVSGTMTGTVTDPVGAPGDEFPSGAGVSESSERGGGVASIGFPQAPQKRAPGSSSTVEQCGQRAGIRLATGSG